MFEGNGATRGVRRKLDKWCKKRKEKRSVRNNKKRKTVFRLFLLDVFIIPQCETSLDVFSAGMLPKAAWGNREDCDFSYPRQGESGQGPGNYCTFVCNYRHLRTQQTFTYLEKGLWKVHAGSSNPGVSFFCILLQWNEITNKVQQIKWIVDSLCHSVWYT